MITATMAKPKESSELDTHDGQAATNLPSEFAPLPSLDGSVQTRNVRKTIRFNDDEWNRADRYLAAQSTNISDFVRYILARLSEGFMLISPVEYAEYKALKAQSEEKENAQ